MRQRIRTRLWISDTGEAAAELLQVALEEEGLESPREILHDALGKPYLDGGPEISLSESGGVAACAIATEPVGVDVQKEDYRPRITERYYSQAERALPFSLVWAEKEAFSKWLGTGLSREILSMDVSQLDFETYKVAEKYYLAVYPGGQK